MLERKYKDIAYLPAEEYSREAEKRRNLERTEYYKKRYEEHREEILAHKKEYHLDKSLARILEKIEKLEKEKSN